MCALMKHQPQRSFDLALMDDFDDYEADLIGAGGSAMVMAINRFWVIKSFANGHDRTQDLQREVKIYEQLKSAKGSPRVVKYVATWGRGIIMERLEMTLRQRLRLPDIDVGCRNRWMLEVCEGISFLHSEGIVHGDIGCQNTLIDRDGHAKICDFAGSKTRDEDSWICYQVRSQHPKYIGKQPNYKTELFALGSALFEIETLRQPYEKLPDSVVQMRFEQGKYPLNEIGRPRVREVVERCWKGKYSTVVELNEDLAKAI